VNDELLAAIAEAGRRHTVWRWEPSSGLRPTPPRPPPKRPSKPVSADVVAAQSSTAPAASKPADDDVAAPEAQRVGGVSVQLDIAVERRRSFWWRLALSMVVRRLGR
jgi:hypothetical protein